MLEIGAINYLDEKQKKYKGNKRPVVGNGLKTNSPPMKLPAEKKFFIDLPLKDEISGKIRKNRSERKKLDVDMGNQTKSCFPGKSVHDSLRRYSDERVTPQILRGIADWLCSRYDFVYIEDMALYIFQNGYFRLFTYAYATRFLIQVFRRYAINYAFRTTDYKELVRLLQAQPQIMKRQDDCKTDIECILFQDGIFHVSNGMMRNPRVEDYQYSKINFPLHWGTEYYPSPQARGFIEKFCSYDATMERYLWELIGYLLSSYQQKIIVVFFGTQQFREINISQHDS